MNEHENKRSRDEQKLKRDARRAAVASVVVIVCLLLTTLGCLPVQIPFLQQSKGEPTRQPPTATATNTVVGYPTWPATWTPTATPTATSTSTPYPTLTPLPGTPWPGGGAAPGTAPGSEGTLGVEFWISNIYCTSISSFNAEFWIRANGGGGGYTYFRDIEKIAGPVSGPVQYTVEWTDCGGAPGTFFVHSADGQKIAKKFWVDVPDCCTVKTPVP